MKLKPLALLCVLASLNGGFSIHAQNAAPPAATPTSATPPTATPAAATPAKATPPPRPSEYAGHPAMPPRVMQNITPQEGKKLNAARVVAIKDPKVLAAMEKLQADSKDYREAMNAAMIAADPTVEPILKRMQAARDQASPRRVAPSTPVQTPKVPATPAESPKAAQ